MAGFKKSADKAELTPEEWVNQIIAQGAASRASDIHFDPFEGNFYIRYRIDGVLSLVTKQPMDIYEMVATRLKVVGQLDITEKRKPQDGRGQIRDQASGKIYEFRISTLPSVFGEAVVIRFSNLNEAIFESFESMGMDPADAELFRFTIAKPHGMILVAGPSGSGKTATLYTAINQLRSPAKNIVTLEDPVEFKLEFVRHCQIRLDVGFTFAEGVKAVLRQDPDVILVGEIRDHETAEAAVRAALSGSLVFSNINTNDSIGTITRFLELGMPRSFLASALLLAVSKRLLRKNCSQCSQPYAPSEKFLKEAGITSLEGTNFRKGAGCEACGHNGYSGRVPVFEFFVVDPEIAGLITEGATPRELLNIARQRGMKTLREAAVRLAVAGDVTLEDAIYATA